jgi:hypothetical protein
MEPGLPLARGSVKEPPDFSSLADQVIVTFRYTCTEGESTKAEACRSCPDGTQAQPANCNKKSCGLKKGPEYNVTGAIAGGSSFHWSATFLNDNTHDPKCCEVRQLISWNHVPIPTATRPWPACRITTTKRPAKPMV